MVPRGIQEVVVPRFVSGVPKTTVDEGVAMVAVDVGCAGTQSQLSLGFSCRMLRDCARGIGHSRAWLGKVKENRQPECRTGGGRAQSYSQVHCSVVLLPTAGPVLKHRSRLLMRGPQWCRHICVTAMDPSAALFRRLWPIVSYRFTRDTLF